MDKKLPRETSHRAAIAAILLAPQSRWLGEFGLHQFLTPCCLRAISLLGRPGPHPEISNASMQERRAESEVLSGLPLQFAPVLERGRPDPAVATASALVFNIVRQKILVVGDVGAGQAASTLPSWLNST